MMDENESPQLTEDEKKLFEDLMPEDLNEILDTGVNRRHFLKLMTLAGGGILAAQSAVAEQVLTRPFAEYTHSGTCTGSHRKRRQRMRLKSTAQPAN